MKRTTVKSVFRKDNSTKEFTETMTIYVENPKDTQEVKKELDGIYKSFNDESRPWEEKRTLLRFEVIKNETF